MILNLIWEIKLFLKNVHVGRMQRPIPLHKEVLAWLIGHSPHHLFPPSLHYGTCALLCRERIWEGFSDKALQVQQPLRHERPSAWTQKSGNDDRSTNLGRLFAAQEQDAVSDFTPIPTPWHGHPGEFKSELVFILLFKYFQRELKLVLLL